jgi:hypothetical protein
MATPRYAGALAAHLGVNALAVGRYACVAVFHGRFCTGFLHQKSSIGDSMRFWKTPLGVCHYSARRRYKTLEKSKYGCSAALNFSNPSGNTLS